MKLTLSNLYALNCCYNFTLISLAATGDGLKRIDFRILTWDVAFAQYVKQLETEKHVIFAGDLNAAHEVIRMYMIISSNAVCVEHNIERIQYCAHRCCISQVALRKI
jgi:exonuclease III